MLNDSDNRREEISTLSRFEGASAGCVVLRSVTCCFLIPLVPFPIELYAILMASKVDSISPERIAVSRDLGLDEKTTRPHRRLTRARGPRTFRRPCRVVKAIDPPPKEGQLY